jgi:hypothetical protein
MNSQSSTKIGYNILYLQMSESVFAESIEVQLVALTHLCREL